MKTVEIVKHTGEFVEEVATNAEGIELLDVDDNPIMREFEVLEQVKSYQCEDGQEDILLKRARLKAEDLFQETGFAHTARIAE